MSPASTHIANAYYNPLTWRRKTFGIVKYTAKGDTTTRINLHNMVWYADMDYRHLRIESLLSDTTLRELQEDLSRSEPKPEATISSSKPLIDPVLFNQLMGSVLKNHVAAPILTPQESHEEYLKRFPEKKTHPKDTPLDHEATKRLGESFAADLEQVSLAGIAMPYPKCSLPKRLATDFRLVPVRSTPTSTQAIERVSVPEGVSTNYDREGGRPYLDTPFAIGLVYRGTLSAVAGAGIDLKGALVIKQNQCVNTADRSREGMNKTGLRNGMAWRHTLVRAWEQIAEQHGFEVMVQGAANNMWRNTVKSVDQLRNAYDQVADDLGYIFNPLDRNWYRNPDFDEWPWNQ